MKLTIKAPTELKISDLSELVSQFAWRKHHRKLVIDLSNLSFIEPIGSAFLTAYILYLRENGLFDNGEIVQPQNKDLHRYLQRMNFYDLLNVHIKEDFFRWNGSGKFQELAKIEDESEVQDALKNMLEIMQKQSALDEIFIDAMNYALSEILENVFHHSNSSIGGIICAQTYPTRGIIQFAIVDTGIGIPESLRDYVGYKNLDDIEALKKAIGAKVTSKPNSHTGEGLFFASKIVELNNGNFHIFSLTARLDISSRYKKAYQWPYWQGSAIVFELPYKLKNSIEDIFNLFAPPQNDFELLEEI